MSGFDLIIKQDQEDVEAAEVFVYGTIGGHQYRFLLDTGAAITSVKLDDYTAGFNCIGEKTSSGLFARCTDDLITVPSIELGPISKRNFTLARMGKRNPDTRNLIDMDLLKDFRCHFFFDEHRVAVDTAGESEARQHRPVPERTVAPVRRSRAPSARAEGSRSASPPGRGCYTPSR